MAQKQAQRKRATQKPISGKALLGVVVVGIALTAGAILFARADEGVINVAEVINRSNADAEATDSPEQKTQKPATNARPDEPNGGLVGTGKPVRESAPEPEPEPDVEGATTTQSSENATSSEAAEDDGAVEEESTESTEESTGDSGAGE